MIIEVKNPFGEDFSEAWELWKSFKDEVHKFKYKSEISEQMAINLLVKLSGGHEEVAIAIIEQSVAAQWRGFFPLKNNHSNGKQPVSNTEVRESINDLLNNRYRNGR